MSRRFQFSLKALLVAVIPLSIWLALVSQAARTQRDVAAMIVAKGGQIWYRHQRTLKTASNEVWDTDVPPAPWWLRRWLGDDYFQTAIAVELYGDKFRDEDLEEIAKLPSLERVWMGYDTPLTAPALRRLKAALPNCDVPDDK